MSIRIPYVPWTSWISLVLVHCLDMHALQDIMESMESMECMESTNIRTFHGFHAIRGIGGDPWSAWISTKSTSMESMHIYAIQAFHEMGDPWNARNPWHIWRWRTDGISFRYTHSSRRKILHVRTTGTDEKNKFMCLLPNGSISNSTGWKSVEPTHGEIPHLLRLKQSAITETRSRKARDACFLNKKPPASRNWHNEDKRTEFVFTRIPKSQNP